MIFALIYVSPRRYSTFAETKLKTHIYPIHTVLVLAPEQIGKIAANDEPRHPKRPDSQNELND